MENLNEFVAVVRSQMQPEARGNAVASTLEQIGALVPEHVELCDLAAAWQTIANNTVDSEEIPVQKRRETCGELAHIYTVNHFPDIPGDINIAAEAWRVWRDAFAFTGDPRQAAMAETFARELRELEA